MKSYLKREKLLLRHASIFDENDDALETLFAARLEIFGTKFDCIPARDCLESDFGDGLEHSSLKPTVSCCVLRRDEF